MSTVNLRLMIKLHVPTTSSFVLKARLACLGGDDEMADSRNTVPPVFGTLTPVEGTTKT
jgi:hypothetical protein